MTRTLWTSPLFAWIVTGVVELLILIDARRNPVPMLAAIQFGLLAVPPVILALAIRRGTYGAVFIRALTVFIIATVLDLFYIR